MKNKMIIAMLAMMLLCSSCQTDPSTKEVYNTNEILTTGDVSKERLSASYSRCYDGPIELLEESDLVVFATSHINQSFVDYENNFVFNYTDFTIDQVLYGQTDEEVITVFESGGVVLYEDVCKLFDREIEKERLGQYVEFNIDNAPNPFIKDHQQYVLFLEKDETTNRYVTIGAFMGRYELNPWGGLVRDEPMPNFYPPTTAYLREDPDASSNPQFTLEQMIEICNEYQNS